VFLIFLPSASEGSLGLDHYFFPSFALLFLSFPRFVLVAKYLPSVGDRPKKWCVGVPGLFPFRAISICDRLGYLFFPWVFEVKRVRPPAVVGGCFVTSRSFAFYVVLTLFFAC